MSKRDIIVTLKKRDEQKEDNREFIKGVIASYQGNVTVPDRPNMCYVKELNLDEAGPFPILNIVTAHVENLRVLIGWTAKPPFGQRAIIGIDDADMELGNNGSNFNLPAHANSHLYFDENIKGTDPVSTYQGSLQLLKTIQSSGLVVQVNPLTYVNNDSYVYFPGQLIDLTSYVPVTANKNVFVLLSLRKQTNSIVVTTGLETTIGITPPKVDIPDNNIPSSYILLQTSQTSIDFTTDFIDSRSFLASPTDTSVIPATQVGQVLYSTDGSTFTAQKPLISDDDGTWIANEDGILIIVG